MRPNRINLLKDGIRLNFSVSQCSQETCGRRTVTCALTRCGLERQVEERGRASWRRQPEGTVLYEAVRDNLATLLAEASEVGGLPRYVEWNGTSPSTWSVEYWRTASRGCAARVARMNCLSPSRTRARGPSCNAKRAHVRAVLLVERVLPHVPYRQWTLSFPHWVRWVLLEDAGLPRTSSPSSRARGKLTSAGGHGSRACVAEAGAVSFIQFFGWALQGTPHFHSLRLVREVVEPATRLLRARYSPCRAIRLGGCSILSESHLVAQFPSGRLHTMAASCRMRLLLGRPSGRAPLPIGARLLCLEHAGRGHSGSCVQRGPALHLNTFR